MAWLWPTYVTTNPTGPARFGRVCHYLGTAGAIAAYLFVFALIRDGLVGVGPFIVPLFFALPIYFVARGVRYMVAGE